MLLTALPTYLPAVVSAQASAQLSDFSLPSFGTSLAIDLTPAYPSPGDTVRLSLHANGIDATGSTIVWRSGGKVLAQGLGTQSVDVTAGALGSETTVTADVSAADGSLFSARATVAPTQLDLLVGSDSYTPPFYRGRALPSAGTTLVMQARARFIRADGSIIPDSDITYTWKEGGEVLGTISGRGRSTGSIPIAHIFGGADIELSAISVDGTRGARTALSVPLIEPLLDLYEDHPLYGILFNRSLGVSAQIAESEMGLVAIPYFASIKSPNDSALAYAWSVNGVPVSANTKTPSSITINADNSTGLADIELQVTHATNYFLDAAGRWSVRFSAGSTSQDPFRAAP